MTARATTTTDNGRPMSGGLRLEQLPVHLLDALDD
jgi:hypothetical protein